MHTSTAVVVVFITDVNDNKPIFEDCASYTPKIEEGAPNGSPIIKVSQQKFKLSFFSKILGISVSDDVFLRASKIYPYVFNSLFHFCISSFTLFDACMHMIIIEGNKVNSYEYHWDHFEYLKMHNIPIYSQDSFAKNFM